ncbi:MAG TPA: 4Fe-4S binding protein [Thermoguttaceae bacterium]|nr:4Fe-4S binding protein [Thermoguttaceae bacterium]
MAAKKKPGNNKGTLTSRLAAWRVWVQTAFATIWLWPFARLHTMCSPVFHCHACPLATFACPIGVIAHFSALHVFPFITLGVIVVFGALFGGFMCGWVCPFGFLQDLFAKIPTPKLTLPAWSGYMRYVVLVVFVLIGPYLFAEKPVVTLGGEEIPLFICRVCPAGALEGAAPNVAAAMATDTQPIPWPSTLKIVILGLFLIAVFFLRRPWCTLFCPLGAIYGLFNYVSFFLLRFHNNKCIDCKNCRSLCQYGGRTDVRVHSTSCNRCLAGEKCRAVTLGTALDRVDS